MTSYRDYQPSLHPTALAGPYGVAWGASQGEMKDRVVTLAVDAVDVGLVAKAPTDALPLLGADVVLEQLPAEPNDSYRARIQAAWETWSFAGTRTALITVANQLGASDSGTAPRLATAHELGRVPWAWWFLFIVPVVVPALRTWGAPETWGAGVWGSDHDRATVRAIRRLLRRFSNARDRGTAVILRTSPGVWGVPGVWGTGTWGGRNVRWRI